jgi:small-conductance mechanosensitive channel
LIAGIYLLIERPFGVGDRISVGNFSGTVMIVDLRTTTMQTEDGKEVIVPKSLIMTEIVVKKFNTSE